MVIKYAQYNINNNVNVSIKYAKYNINNNVNVGIKYAKYNINNNVNVGIKYDYVRQLKYYLKKLDRYWMNTTGFECNINH